MGKRTTDTILIISVVAMLLTLAFFVSAGATADKVAVLRTAGMTCAGCVADIEGALQGKEGIASLKIDRDAGLVTIAYDSGKAAPEALAEAVTGLGYGSSIVQVMTFGEYRARAGTAAALTPAGTGGCGGCCNRGRN
jgi:copper chaperone CopZ